MDLILPSQRWIQKQTQAAESSSACAAGELNQLITMTLFCSFRLLDFMYLYKLYQCGFQVAKRLLSPTLMTNSTLTSKIISKEFFLIAVKRQILLPHKKYYMCLRQKDCTCFHGPLDTERSMGKGSLKTDDMTEEKLIA